MTAEHEVDPKRIVYIVYYHTAEYPSGLVSMNGSRLMTPGWYRVRRHPKWGDTVFGPFDDPPAAFRDGAI